jgi:hypothetical protein
MDPARQRTSTVVKPGYLAICKDVPGHARCAVSLELMQSSSIAGRRQMEEKHWMDRISSSLLHT